MMYSFISTTTLLHLINIFFKTMPAPFYGTVPTYTNQICNCSIKTIKDNVYIIYKSDF